MMLLNHGSNLNHWQDPWQFLQPGPRAEGRPHADSDGRRMTFRKLSIFYSLGLDATLFGTANHWQCQE